MHEPHSISNREKRLCCLKLERAGALGRELEVHAGSVWRSGPCVAECRVLRLRPETAQR